MLHLLFLSCSLFLSHKLIAQEGGRSPNDPVAGIQYERAFDQRLIMEKHLEWLKEQRCWLNIGEIIESKKSGKEEAKEGEVILYVGGEKELTAQDFQKECLDLLTKERTHSIMKPARVSGSLLGLMVLTTGGLTLLIGADSFGGSFGIFALSINSVFFFKEIIDSCWNWKDTPNHPLDAREKEFAIKRCEIPKDLWPAIIEKFIIARTNLFSQRKAIDFIDFALGMNLYQNLHPLCKKPSEFLAPLLKSLDEYFQKYEAFSNPDDLLKLKANIQRFLFRLENQDAEPSRPIYLTGPGGIGKTHFASWLESWMESHLPKSCILKKFVIYSPEELKGSQEEPGAFLNALRQLCQSQTHGVISFFDEANWVTEKTYNQDVKLTFDSTNLKNLSTFYFGEGIDGSGLKLPMPPMLVLLASNHPIENIDDEALLSRFDQIHFPFPKKQALWNYGNHLITDDILYSSFSKKKDWEQVLRILFESENPPKSFRDMEIKIPFLMIEAWEEEQP